jgi:radical SAM-linked protein
LLRRPLIEDPDKPILLVLIFAVSGPLRFLSHAETLRLIQRTCARAAVDVAYAGRFNPRPRISLPLPRTVGLACRDETCVIRLNPAADAPDLEQLADSLAVQFPQGIDLLDAKLLHDDVSFSSGTAVYQLSVKSAHLATRLERAVAEVLAAESLKVSRSAAPGRKTPTVDVRPFLESIDVKGPTVTVAAAFGPNGTIRVEEILSLLSLDLDALDGPVVRTKVLFKSVLKSQRNN